MTDACVSSAASVQLPLPYPVKCETGHVQLAVDSPGVADNQQLQQQAGIDEQSSSVTVPSSLPSTVVVVTTQSLSLQDPSIFYQRYDAIAAAAAANRNVTPVKCTSTVITLDYLFHLRQR